MSTVHELPALLEMIEEMRGNGDSEEEIASFLEALDRKAWDKANDEMRAAGISEAEIQKFWEEVDYFGDSDSADMVDESDEDN